MSKKGEQIIDALREAAEREPTQLEKDNAILCQAMAHGIATVDKNELIRILMEKLVFTMRITNELAERLNDLTERSPKSALILPDRLNS